MLWHMAVRLTYVKYALKLSLFDVVMRLVHTTRTFPAGFACLMWYVINTKPHCEYKVIAQLEREGSVSYLPLARRWRRPHGRRRPYLAEVPGFPSYLFMRPPAPERRLEYGHLLIVAGQYCTIDDKEIETMQQAQFIFDETPHMKQRKRRGDKAHAKHPLFGNMAGKVIMSSAQHAVLELPNGLRVNVPVELLSGEAA